MGRKIAGAGLRPAPAKSLRVGSIVSTEPSRVLIPPLNFYIFTRC